MSGKGLSSYIILFFLLAVCLPTVQAQQHAPIPKPQPVRSFPAYSKYKKRPPVKVNPYLVDTLLHPIPMARVLFHDNIDKAQKQADIADGTADNAILLGDSAAKAMLTETLLRDVDSMQIMIENMPANGRDALVNNQQKIRYLRAVWEMIRLYNRDASPDVEYYKMLELNMHGMLVAINENKLMEFAVANTNIYTLENGKTLFDSYPDVRAYIYTRVGMADPVTMIKRLDEYASDTFAGNIIKAAARLVPAVIFNYATSTNLPLKNAVFRTKDAFVQAIVQIASRSRAPLKALPYLTDVYYGRRTVEEIDALAARPDEYYKGLVRLKIENDSLGRSNYTSELAYRSLYYVRRMDELHELRDDERFRCIDSLPAASLYYALVYGQEEIYTSSFLGAFKRLIERMKPLTGDQLLDSLHYDHFRTFIRMCAGYNTLPTFLGTMNDTTKTAVMSRFIGGLQKGKDDELEDAVDVADAFGSIRDSALSAFLQKKVKENYEQSYKDGSRKGMIVYSLLAMLFDGNKISGSDTGAAVASKRLHLPPINKVPYKELISDSGIVYQQVFFFGDKDGQDSYAAFIDEFKKDKNWKVATEKYWVQISSISGKPTVIYANLPLKEPQDEQAIDSLSQHLAANNIRPTVMIHRGHSYHLPLTLAHLTADARIVILGSCGGYQNLAKVLDHSPEAHIISSKQTGVMAVNGPILRSLNNTLVQGGDVNWINMWHDLEDYFSKKPDALEKFSDYVPPYKNLGAIFIKAYRRIMYEKEAAAAKEE